MTRRPSTQFPRVRGSFGPGVEAEVSNNEFFLFQREGGSWKMRCYIFTANKPDDR